VIVAAIAFVDMDAAGLVADMSRRHGLDGLDPEVQTP